MPTTQPRRTTNIVEHKPPADQRLDIEDLLSNLQLDLNHNRTPQQQSPLLALPAELRFEIYTAVLHSSPTKPPQKDNNQLSLLRLSRQISMESTHLLYQRPLTFPSQSSLFSWLSQSSPSDLKRVRNLTLHLTDINLSSLFSPSRRLNAWDLYQRELEALDSAILALPGLLDLLIIPPERTSSQLLRGMYLSFLGMIPERLPRLRSLTVHDSESLLEKLPSLTRVANLVFERPRRSISGASSGTSSSEEEFRRIAGLTVKQDDGVKMEVDD